MALRVHVICQNYQEDRVIPRHARHLAERLGWSLGAGPDPSADVTYLLSYFEAQRLRPWPAMPVAANFTHREEEPPNNAKAKCFDRVAGQVQLRTAWAAMYLDQLAPYGPTVKVSPALERDHFSLTVRVHHARPVVGFSGYTYANHRKGEDLVKGIVNSPLGQRVEWRASGRGWPVKAHLYAWEQMPGYYRSLDVLVIPSRVEGIPMPPLEALCCGASVVIPRGVGLLDELPDVCGIYRYDRGDLPTLLQALERAVEERAQTDPEALRAATARYSVEQWCEDHADAFAEHFEPRARPSAQVKARSVKGYKPPQAAQPARGKRGIYCVAYGEPARAAALDLMTTAKRHMPDIPIALCAASPIGPEDVLIREPDSDIGARQNKIRMYELAPQEWDTVLYMDADIEVIAPVYQYFEWAEDGWDLVITKDPHLVDTMHSYERPNNDADMASVQRALKTLNALQLAGGVMCFRRGARVKEFFDAWLAEWNVHGQRDQGPLVRALYAHPLKVWLLGSQWNTFLRYMPREQSAGLVHFPGKARRWMGLIPGRIDSPEAWAAVKRFEMRSK